MSKQPCTADGFAAAEAELLVLNSRGNFRRNVKADGELSAESMATQRELVDREVSDTQTRINALAKFTSTHVPQPFPIQFETVELGHPVTIVYLNRQGEELHKNYVIAGAGEPDIYLGSGFMMLKAISPLGELLMGRRVGDVFDAFLDGDYRDVRVEAIHQKLQADGADAEESASKSTTREVTVSRLSINGTGQRVSAAA